MEMHFLNRVDVVSFCSPPPFSRPAVRVRLPHIGCHSKKYAKHLLFAGKSVPLQADYYQKRLSD
ncbi:MAG TPA: hypothetical protein H9819_08395 [Candidatus Bacteroides merdipullorum]|uniref:Uncharacterized protein n=1 Tax=Candidatus Bacteroides merdipullorum TaxID=2838474 RepID=A0A9D2A6B8_9BACE|nr:hypothetical protein [Candidatus Bacteroides merdipullorum]